jgi:hypothetical protein
MAKCIDATRWGCRYVWRALVPSAVSIDAGKKIVAGVFLKPEFIPSDPACFELLVSFNPEFWMESVGRGEKRGQSV